MLPLTGYADRFSVAPGQTIAFKVSSAAATPYQVRLVRLISGDPNPAGPGIKEEPVPAPFAASYPSRVQPVPLGSYVRVPDAPAFRELDQLHDDGDHLADHARPGPPGRRGPPRSQGRRRVRALRGRARRGRRGRERPRRRRDGPRRQAPPGADLVPRLGRLRRGHAHALGAARRRSCRASGRTTPAHAAVAVDFSPALDSGTPLLVAAAGRRARRRPLQRQDRAPALYDVALGETASRPLRTDLRRADLVAAWDFSRDLRAPARRGRRAERAPRRAGQPPGARHDGLDLDGRGDVLAPRARASTAPSTSTTTTSTTAAGTPTSPTPCRTGSGAASTRCGSRAGDVEDMIPFFVRPPRGRPARGRLPPRCRRSRTSSTRTSRATSPTTRTGRASRRGARGRGRRDEHRDYGLSTYNFHHDGSGIAYSSRLRPIMTCARASSPTSTRGARACATCPPTRISSPGSSRWATSSTSSPTRTSTPRAWRCSRRTRSSSRRPIPSTRAGRRSTRWPPTSRGAAG